MAIGRVGFGVGAAVAEDDGRPQATWPAAGAGTSRRLWAQPRWDPYWLAAALFLAYAALSLARYRRMMTLSWDLGIFEQAIRGYAHLHAPIADIKGPGTNILGDHFSPIIALIAPFYRLFPTPVTLLVAQAALFAFAAVPVTRVAARLLGRGQGVAIGIAYGLSWGVQRAVEFDFHEIAFAMPLLALSLEAILRGRWWTALAWAFPLVLVKEDMGLTTAAIAFVVALRARNDPSRGRVVPCAIALAVFGVLATVLALTVIIPAFNTGGDYGYWQKLTGHGVSGSRHVPPGIAVRTVLWILVPTSGLYALRSPLLLVAVPTIGWRLAAKDDHYWGLDWHYSAVLMPVALLALVDAIARDRARTGMPRRLRAYAARLPAAVAVAALALTTTLPLGALLHWGAYRVDARTIAVKKLLRRIPDGATVESDTTPISRLTRRTTVYWIGDAKGIAPDYITFSLRPLGRGDPLGYARALHPGATYDEVARAGGHILLRRD
ncbi:DUF2079 domain-containing protein [Actinoallomurus purpureus]|uniref:DUF2079 domain-containing protein n=1 Tax=Actinoallomurus purpureus TaxID=478114 RepID=UPI0020922440|nr:DUF2079 domain-containing protein [Actinoallomurus purpureus]MCO6007516.1 DUF2079 domain-containing protein [Actinoallomurus purpureus]